MSAAEPRSARLTVESSLIGLAFGLLVVGPWTHGGYLLLLDWVSGPHQAATPGLYGLDPASLDAMPYRIGTQFLREVVGARVTGWLVVLLYFPMAAGGVSSLAGGSRWRRHPAALLAVCNPFVVERIRAGHVAFLLSVALLTWLLASAVHARRRNKPFAARPAGWYAVAMAVSPHGAWLGAVALLLVAVLPRARLRDLFRTGVVMLAACGVYLYAVVVLLAGVHTLRVTALDLDAYATRAGPGGLLATVASLHGFWREAEGLPPDYLGPLVLAVLLAAVLAGAVRLCRCDPDLGAPLAALTITGLALGAGVNGPLGAAYRAAFGTVPLFEAMREQQKWAALAMVGYAVTVGVTVEALAGLVRASTPSSSRLQRPVARVLAGLAGMAIASVYLAVAPSLVWGLGGSTTVVRYPDSWYAADRIMGDGSGAVLFLPWHGYQSFNFTQHRSVATPASAFFQRPVLSSDAVELGALQTNSVSRRISYVQRLIADGGGGSFGRLVAPLGVEYVALARDREADSYAWLDRQIDLHPVLHTTELDLYRVDPAIGRVISARSASYADATALAERGELGTEALLDAGPTEGALPSTAAGGIRRTSSTSWSVDAGTPGWVVLPEEWSPGWQVEGRRGQPTTAGTVAIQVGAGATTIEYAPWRFLRLGLLASILFFAALVVAGLVEHRRELSSWWSRRRGARPPPALTPQ